MIMNLGFFRTSQIKGWKKIIEDKICNFYDKRRVANTLQEI